MAHAPVHPDNPCSFDENEKNPAKIWELLRRNENFKKAVERLKEVDNRPRLKAGDAGRQPYHIGLAMVGRLRELHRFAHVAIQWLVPNPLFEIRHVAIPAGIDLTGRDSVPLETVKLQLGVTADPWDTNWRTFEAHGDQDAQSVANCNGYPWRRGPRVEMQTSDDARFCSKVDPIREWRSYFQNGKSFTLDMPWKDSPPQFKREFCYLWRYLDSRTKNPITGTRIDAPVEHETAFFEGWSMMSCLGKKPNHEETFVRAIMFDELAQHYRVFAFPRSIRSRTEARRIAGWLMKELCRSPNGGTLPAQEPHIFGTPIQWDVFLSAGRCDDESLKNAYRLVKPQINGADRVRKWRKERLNYIEHFRAIHHAVTGIFPRQDLTPVMETPSLS